MMSFVTKSGSKVDSAPADVMTCEPKIAFSILLFTFSSLQKFELILIHDKHAHFFVYVTNNSNKCKIDIVFLCVIIHYNKNGCITLAVIFK